MACCCLSVYRYTMEEWESHNMLHYHTKSNFRSQCYCYAAVLPYGVIWLGVGDKGMDCPFIVPEWISFDCLGPIKGLEWTRIKQPKFVGAQSNFHLCYVALQPLLHCSRSSTVIKWWLMRAAYLEGFEIVDEDIWHPEVVDEVEIDGVQLLLVHWAESKIVQWSVKGWILCNHPVCGWM